MQKRQKLGEIGGAFNNRGHEIALGEAGLSEKGEIQTALETGLRRRQTQPGCKAFWDPKELDRYPTRRWDTRVASEPLLKVEPVMRTLCTRERDWHEKRVGREAS